MPKFTKCLLCEIPTGKWALHNKANEMSFYQDARLNQLLRGKGLCLCWACSDVLENPEEPELQFQAVSILEWHTNKGIASKKR